MPCPRCKGRTRAGGQCQRATCKFAPKCFQHTAVEVRPSPIGGRGLFAKRRITSGEVVADYTMAERISAAQYQALGRANQATHVAQIKGVHYDARDVRRTVAGMANTARNVQGARHNLNLPQNGKLKATTNVPAGRELLLGYGPGYHLQRQNNHGVKSAQPSNVKRPPSAYPVKHPNY